MISIQYVVLKKTINRNQDWMEIFWGTITQKLQKIRYICKEDRHEIIPNQKDIDIQFYYITCKIIKTKNKEFFFN